MTDLTQYLTSGGAGVLVVGIVVRGFFSSYKDRIAWMHKTNIDSAVKDERIRHNREITELKAEHADFRFKILEKK